MSDNDFIRRGDAVAAAANLYRWSIAAGEELEAAIRAIPAADAAHVNETLKSEHDAGNVLTDAAQSRAPFFFDRYINGVRMAEDVCIERETTLEGAMQAAARIAAKGPNGEAPVLIYRAPAALTDGGSEYERKVAQMKKDFPNGI